MSDCVADMRPAAVLCNGNGVLSRSASFSTQWQLAQHAHMLRRDIGCPMPAPLRSAYYCTMTRRQAVVLSHAWKRTCSFSSTRQLLHSQHPGSSHRSCSQLPAGWLLQCPSRPPGSNVDGKPTRLAATGSSFGSAQSMDDDEEVRHHSGDQVVS